MQQLEDSLKAATKEDAAVSADLNLDRQVLDIVIKMNDLTGELDALTESGDRTKKEGAAEKDREQRMAELEQEQLRTLGQLEPLTREGSVLANYVWGCTLLRYAREERATREASQQTTRRKKGEKASRDRENDLLQRARDSPVPQNEATRQRTAICPTCTSDWGTGRLQTSGLPWPWRPGNRRPC